MVRRRLGASRGDGKWGYISRQGNTIIPVQFVAAKSFSEGLAPASADGRHWGYIRRTGLWAIAPRFYDAGAFRHGIAVVGEGNERAWIDWSGKTVNRR